MLNLTATMPGLCGADLMRRTFVSIDPSLKTLSSPYLLQRNIRLVSPKGGFLEHGCYYHRHAPKSENVRNVIDKNIMIFKT